MSEIDQPYDLPKARSSYQREVDQSLVEFVTSHWSPESYTITVELGRPITAKLAQIACSLVEHARSPELFDSEFWPNGFTLTFQSPLPIKDESMVEESFLKKYFESSEFTQTLELPRVVDPLIREAVRETLPSRYQLPTS